MNTTDLTPLPARPSLEQYKKQAKDFVKACKSGDSQVDRSPAVGINDAALITPATGDLVGVPPEVPKLGAVPTDNEQCRRRTKRIPTLAGRG
jgi:hypothetical protein